jgi:hypothetical protein
MNGNTTQSRPQAAILPTPGITVLTNRFHFPIGTVMEQIFTVDRVLLWKLRDKKCLFGYL